MRNTLQNVTLHRGVLSSKSAPSSSCWQVQSVVVIGAEGAVALWTLSLSRLVTRTQAVPAKHVEALCEHSIFAFHLARRTRQCLLVLPQLFSHHLIQGLGKLDLFHTFDLASKLRYLLLKYDSRIGI